MQTSRQPSSPAAYRVLVADDNHDLADTLGLLLGLAMACEVEVVYDGQQALDHALAMRPDAAIFDLEMPLMDGAHAAADVKRAFADNPPVLIAMSGNPDTLQLSQGAGQGAPFDRAFCKPFDFEQLVDALRQRGAPLPLDH